MKSSTAVLLLTVLTLACTARAAHPLRDDVNKDAIGEIFFGGGTSLAYWNIYTITPDQIAPAVSSHYVGDGGPGYSVVAVADFDGDGSADVLWTDGSHLKMWINDGSGRYTAVSVGSYAGGWQPFAAGDINGDRKADLYFRGGTHIAYWMMDGPKVTRSSYAGDGGAGYHVVAISDADDYLLWTNGSHLKMWGIGRDGNFTPTSVGTYGGGWEPFALGDVDGDGEVDILFRGGSSIAYWLIRDKAVVGSYFAGTAEAGYRPVAVTNYNNDQHSADILWTNGSNIRLWVNGCSPWGYDVCSPLQYESWNVGTYGNGWQPLDMHPAAY